jgi:D-aminoacyl-tRNA deacylase
MFCSIGIGFLATIITLLDATMVVVKVIAQRVSRAAVRVSGMEIARIGSGLCLLVGIANEDDFNDVEAAVRKISQLRVFSDQSGQMNLSLVETGGEVLVVSQFTLYGDISRGRRPSFSGAGDPDHALVLIERLVAGFRDFGISVSSGEFGAKMEVELVNEGPVTFSIEIRAGKVL